MKRPRTVSPAGGWPTGVVDMTDTTNAELRAEVERLRRWKAEATEVALGLQDVGKALGLGLGEQITGASAAAAANRLSARAKAAEAQVARVEGVIGHLEGIEATAHVAPDAGLVTAAYVARRLRAALTEADL